MQLSEMTRKIHDVLKNPSMNFVLNAVAALIRAGKGRGLEALEGKESLSRQEFDNARRILNQHLTTLAKLSLAASGQNDTPRAPSKPVEATKPAAPVKPSALPPRGYKAPPKPRKPRAEKQPKLPKPERVSTGRAGPLATPDVNGMAPWEADDAAWRAEMEVMAIESSQF